MKKIFPRAFKWWFVLLAAALLNATVRETTYKPLLTPIIGLWAHQISSITGILLFYLVIYRFLKPSKVKYTTPDLLKIGTLWIIMTLVFETFMNVFLRHLTLSQVLSTYYFWQGETWVFVLLSLLILPYLIAKKQRLIKY